MMGFKSGKSLPSNSVSHYLFPNFCQLVNAFPPTKRYSQAYLRQKGQKGANAHHPCICNTINSLFNALARVSIGKNGRNGIKSDAGVGIDFK